MPPRLPVIVLLAVSVLAACAGESDDGADAPDASTTSRLEDGATTSTTAPGGPCAWANRADVETLNIAYPDAAATYWGLAYSLADGESLELHGSFPAARYASFISYRPTGGAIDVLTDRDIVPDEGSSNPFGGDREDGEGSEYTAIIVAASDDDRPNVITALEEPDTSGTTTTTPTITLPPDTPRTNVLGSGGDDGVLGTVLYRVYVPDDPSDPAGGGGLPDVSLIGSDGEAQAIATCASPGANPAAEALVETYGPPTDRPAPPTPVFVRPAAGAANLFPNPDNVYIASIVEYVPGRIVVVRGKAPSFADPTEGRPIGGGEQVRYWSLCTNEYRKPYPVSACVVDRDVVLDAEGRYAIVVSTEEDRPANATSDNGITWLDWGPTEVNNLLLLRHMLADPDFAESAINVAPATLATSTMGDYAPIGAYCERSAFEAGGAEACSG